MPSANWKKLTFGECVTLRSGGTPSKSNPAYWNGSIPWVSCKDMKVSRIHDSGDHVTEEGAENGTRIVPKGTILIVVRGMILAKEFPVAIAQRSVTFNQDLKAIECKNNIYASFFYYWLLANAYEVKGIADEAAHGTKRLQTDRLLKLPLDVPPVALQRKIASILSAYDDLIENNTRRIAILEAMAQALYREWFVEFRFPGHENVKFLDSPMRKTPEGWEVVSLSSMMSIQGGSQPPKSKFKYESTEDYIRLIQIRDYETDNHITFVPISSQLRLCNERDIMIARYGASVARICWGLIGAYNVALAKVIPEKAAYRLFLKEFLLSDFFQKSLIGMSGRAAQNGFNKGDISAIHLARPSEDELFHRYESFAEPIESEIISLRKKNENLRKTRELLLPKLVFGQLDVEDLDIDTGETAP